MTNFYIADGEDNRDGIGQDWKHLKSGATFYVTKFSEILEIIENPLQNLLAVEGIFQNQNTTKAVRFKTTKYPERFIAYRTLGRQQAGECDKFAVADKYFEFQRADRTQETLQKLGKATSNFLTYVQQSMPTLTWDYFTFVSDKKQLNHQTNLSELFDIVEQQSQSKNLSFGLTKLKEALEAKRTIKRERICK
ncbi:MAG: hypothetical protein IPH04_06320 [Saprospirales bacterium]|nr:hypothetical protein [Saprospirales bacterium]